MDNSPGAPSAGKAWLTRFYRDVTGLPRNIVPWGFEDYAHPPRTPFIDDPHLSLPPSPGGPRRDTYGSMASAAIGNPLPAQVAGFFDRSDYTFPGRRPRSIHGNVTFPASTRRRSKTCRDPFAASSMTAQSRCSSTSLPPLM